VCMANLQTGFCKGGHKMFHFVRCKLNKTGQGGQSRCADGILLIGEYGSCLVMHGRDL